MSDDEADAFTEMYERYYRQVLGFTLPRTSPELARDAVADTFLVAWRRRHEQHDDQLPWLLAAGCGAQRVASAAQRCRVEFGSDDIGAGLVVDEGEESRGVEDGHSPATAARRRSASSSSTKKRASGTVAPSPRSPATASCCRSSTTH